MKQAFQGALWIIGFGVLFAILRGVGGFVNANDLSEGMAIVILAGLALAIFLIVRGMRKADAYERSLRGK